MNLGRSSITCFFLSDMNMLGFHSCLYPLAVLDPLEAFLSPIYTNYASICVLIMAGLLVLPPSYLEIPNCETGPLVWTDTLTSSLLSKIRHHLALLYSDPQNLALTLKLEHSEGRKCVSVILLA